jgi:hypothetical protein
VTRADFAQDVREPDKQAPWRELAHRHAYAVPAGLVNPREVPAGSGLLEVTFEPGGTSCRFRTNAPRAATAAPLPLANVLDAFYRWSRAEALTLGLVDPVRGVGSDDVEAMRAQLKKVTHDLDLARNEVERQRERAELWRRRYGACGHPPCATCGHPLRPTRKKGWLGDGWEHLTAADTAGCDILRTAAAVQARDASTDEWVRKSSLHVPGPEPRDPEPAPTA